MVVPQDGWAAGRLGSGMGVPCGSGPLEGAASFGTFLGRKVPLGPLLQKHFTQLFQHVLRGRFSLSSSVSLRTVSAQGAGECLSIFFLPLSSSST